jgi:hypothetical protein
LDELREVALPDTEGNIVPLSDLWSDHPAVVVWLRHYR